MDNYTKEEVMKAHKEVASTINKCEKMQVKFAEGTSQHSLLRNRIKAMYISNLVIENELYKIEEALYNDAYDEDKKCGFVIKNIKEHYTKEELIAAIRPIVSIINKCEKAQEKFEEGTTHHTRFKNIIRAMNISKTLIEGQIFLLEEISKL